MSIEPDQIRPRIEELLTELTAEADIDESARRLEEAHDILLRALESVERG
ncbi:MAG TPA: hypothetical protein VFR27_01745 [Mycobacterium sp.]|nr:hypothetical protein [Mycobacterium sp.]